MPHSSVEKRYFVLSFVVWKRAKIDYVPCKNHVVLLTTPLQCMSEYIPAVIVKVCFITCLTFCLSGLPSPPPPANRYMVSSAPPYVASLIIFHEVIEQLYLDNILIFCKSAVMYYIPLNGWMEVLHYEWDILEIVKNSLYAKQ